MSFSNDINPNTGSLLPVPPDLLRSAEAHQAPPGAMPGIPSRTQVDDLDMNAVRSALEGKILELRTAGLTEEAHAAAQVLSELG